MSFEYISSKCRYKLAKNKISFTYASEMIVSSKLGGIIY